MMNVSLTNEVCSCTVLDDKCLMLVVLTQGPITFTLDSRKFEYVSPPVLNSGGSNKTAVPLPK